MSSANSSLDLEKQICLRSGYPSLAAWIAGDPDNETYVFRKFDRLSARNLLKLQYNMIELEANIDAVDMNISMESDIYAKRTMKSWATYGKHSKTLTEPLTTLEKRKKELEDDLEGKIKQYRKYSTKKRIVRPDSPGTTRRSPSASISDSQPR
jgi:hypothetical protein